MAIKGDIITASDFIELKALVKAEMKRRGKTEGKGYNQSCGSAASYAGASYDYSVTPTAGGKILEEHIMKVLGPLNVVVSGLGVPVTEGKRPVVANELTSAASSLGSLASIAPTANSTAASGCASNCMGLCYNGCYSNCLSSCINTCSGGCQGNCGDDCEGGCDSTCYGGCSDSCDSTCTMVCGSNCYGGCAGGCGGCTGTCSVTCNDLAWWNA